MHACLDSLIGREARGSSSLATVCVGLGCTHCNFDVIFGSQIAPNSRPGSSASLPSLFLDIVCMRLGPRIRYRYIIDAAFDATVDGLGWSCQ